MATENEQTEMNSMSSMSTALPAGSADGTSKAHPTHVPGGTFSRFELTGKVAVVSGGARGLGCGTPP